MRNSAHDDDEVREMLRLTSATMMDFRSQLDEQGICPVCGMKLLAADLLITSLLEGEGDMEDASMQLWTIARFVMSKLGTAMEAEYVN